MSKKSKIVVIGSMLFVFIVLFIKVVIPFIIKDLSDHEFPKDFSLIWMLLILLITLAILIISIGTSFFFMEFFVREKTVLSGRPMTGIFSLITFTLITIAYPMESMEFTTFESIYALSAFVVIGITIVLMSKVMCFFMIKKGFDMPSIFFFMIPGTFVNYFILNALIFGNSRVGWIVLFLGSIVTVICLYINWKEILKLKNIKNPWRKK